ncbi:MAG: hypothetical protein FRX49_12217 [Trebouxia sp. A1-2]|nr:MAG: hypothetical protein FRX49_12217 [Trebouxia sp. A1-2]
MMLLQAGSQSLGLLGLSVPFITPCIALKCSTTSPTHPTEVELIRCRQASCQGAVARQDASLAEAWDQNGVKHSHHLNKLACYRKLLLDSYPRESRRERALTGSCSCCMEGNSSGAIQGSVPRMFPLTKVAAFFLDSPREGGISMAASWTSCHLPEPVHSPVAMPLPTISLHQPRLPVLRQICTKKLRATAEVLTCAADGSTAADNTCNDQDPQLWPDSWPLDQGMWQKQPQWFSDPTLVPPCLLSPTHEGTVTVIMSGVTDNDIV